MTSKKSKYRISEMIFGKVILFLSLFQKSFLHFTSKNDLRLKIRLLKFLAVSNQKKLDLEKFFDTVNARNDSLVQIKNRLIQLLNKLAQNEIIMSEIEILLKSDKIKYYLIQNLAVSDITRWVKCI